MALPDIITRSPTRNVRGKPGHAPYILEFSDRYSVYEWGEMPDEIQGKAEGLAFLGWFFFDYLARPDVWQDEALFPAAADRGQLADLREKGLPHHMIGLAGGDLRPLTLDREILSPSKFLLLKPLAYPRSEDEKGRVGDARVLPVLARFEFSRDTRQMPGVTLLESCDTQLVVKTVEDAARDCGLTASDMTRMAKLAELVALRLRATFAAIGVELTSGKLQFAAADGSATPAFMLVDALGPDTLMLEVNGVRISQDVLCQSYRGTNWLMAVEKAKAMAAERQERDWKRICTEELKSQPPLLSPIVKEKASMVYKSLAKALCQRYHGRPVFATAWDIPQLAEKLKPRTAA
jgi:phosphoribosylaminoimidazole-succinocarboxamide synthase